MEASENKPVRVILNSLTPAEQRAIGDRWAAHKGPRMSLTEVMAHAETVPVLCNELSEEEADATAERLFTRGSTTMSVEQLWSYNRGE